jgi:hypothetical protein
LLDFITTYRDIKIQSMELGIRIKKS